MEKSSLKFADAGDASLLVFDIPEELTSSQSHAKCFVIPVLSRAGGLAMMIPLNALDQEKLLDELHHDGDGLLGPSKSSISELFSEDDDGNLVGSGVSCRFLVADFSDDILVFLHEYDDSLDEASEIIPFDSEHPSCLPSTFGIPEQVRAWAEEGATGRVHFYSAQEDPNVATPTAKGAPAVPKKQGAKKLTNSALAEMVQQLSVQVQALTAQSERSRNLSPKWPPQRAVIPAEEQPDGRAGLVGPKMPGVAESLQVGRAFGTPSMDAVHKAALSIGPPPKVRGIPKLPGGSPQNQVLTIEEEPKAWDQPGIAADPMLHALSQQSSALTTLVAHLTSASDPFGDLSAASSTGATSSMRGAQRRERLQSELSSGNSVFFHQMLQQMHRRMFPSRPVPQTDQEFQSSQLSMLTYLERFGGYKHHRENGLLMWALCHVIDSMIQGNQHMAREHLALLVASLEQATLDGGDWSIAYLMTLCGDPPVQVFQDRHSVVQGHTRPFAPLAPGQWCTVILAYLKDLEIMNNRKQETTTKPKSSAPKSDDSPSPKRKPRFPRKPKASPDNPN